MTFKEQIVARVQELYKKYGTKNFHSADYGLGVDDTVKLMMTEMKNKAWSIQVTTDYRARDLIDHMKTYTGEEK